MGFYTIFFLHLIFPTPQQLQFFATDFLTTTPKFFAPLHHVQFFG